MTDGYDLSRRKVLAGLGTIGVAGAAAGAGTTAYFSDGETFEDNSVQAGTFSMDVELLDLDGAVDQDGMGPDEDDWYGEADGDSGLVGAPIQIGDLKPGDTYRFCWCIRVYDNPGVVRAFVPSDSVTNQTGAEAGVVDADDIHDIDSNDEFETLLGSEHVTVEKDLYVCEVEEDELVGDKLKETVSYEPDQGGDYDWDGGLGNFVSSLWDEENSRQDGVPIGSHDGVGHRADGNLDQGRADYVLIGDDGDGNPVDGADYPAVAVCAEISVAEEAGNELQGAQLGFDLEFLAEQARHNDYPFAGMATRPRVDEIPWDDPAELPIPDPYW
ncbi:SipW-dependent-type signal peptide-containing protein [Halovivax cerinus]|uniref:SipW-dependent-type signal peptide-containing protein n=1 Tax=Halovivax cerinus TaxID=1487865 RepID=A0ABD5NRW6_9EURY|nr:SipW-dependent-type signal peptide-containing protein [Halovivax cerinus]